MIPTTKIATMIHNVFTFFRSIHHTSIVIPSGINPGANEFKTVWIFVTPSPTLIANGVSTAVQCGAFAARAVVEPKKRHGQEDAQLQKTVPDV